MSNEHSEPVATGAVAEPVTEDLTESIAEWLEAHHVNDPQTAWELACDLEPIVRRLVESCRDIVTR